MNDDRRIISTAVRLYFLNRHSVFFAFFFAFFISPCVVRWSMDFSFLIVGFFSVTSDRRFITVRYVDCNDFLTG